MAYAPLGMSVFRLPFKWKRPSFNRQTDRHGDWGTGRPGSWVFGGATYDDGPNWMEKGG